VEEDDQEGGKKGRRIGIAFLAFLLLAATVLFVVTLQLEWTLFSTPQVNNQSSTTNHSSLGVPDQDGGGGEEAAVHWWNRLVNAWGWRFIVKIYIRNNFLT
jgi:hypothetical protein